MPKRLRDGNLVVSVLSAALIIVYLFPVYWMAATSLNALRDISAIPPKLVP